MQASTACVAPAQLTLQTTRDAEAQRARLTPEFLEYSRIIAIANNTKVFFGQSIPHMCVRRARDATGSSTPRSARCSARARESPHAEKPMKECECGSRVIQGARVLVRDGG